MSSGGVEKGRVVLMWTRRVEWARASARQTTGWSRVGGWKFLFLGADKISLEAACSDLPWDPEAARAPVRGPSEDVSVNLLHTKQDY